MQKQIDSDTPWLSLKKEKSTSNKKALKSARKVPAKSRSSLLEPVLAGTGRSASVMKSVAFEKTVFENQTRPSTVRNHRSRNM